MKKAMFLAVLCLFLAGFLSVSVLAAEVASQQQVKPKEIKIDRNYDGIIDRTEFYDAKGAVVKVESDINADGKVDEWVYYENGAAIKGEKDINNDGKPDTTLIYDSKGVVIRTEADANGDGKIDEWVHYEAGKPVKAEKDVNKDGKPDTWLTY